MAKKSKKPESEIVEHIRPEWAKAHDLNSLCAEVKKISERIDRIISAHETCKSLKGL